jgi:hypothetical protein
VAGTVLPVFNAEVIGNRLQILNPPVERIVPHLLQELGRGCQ